MMGTNTWTHIKLNVEDVVSKLSSDLVHVGFSNKIHLSPPSYGKGVIGENEVTHYENERSQFDNVFSKYDYDNSYSHIEPTI